MKKLNQNGFGILPVILLVAVVGIVAFAAMRVVNRDTPVADSSSSQLSKENPESVQINKASDLDTASKSLDATPIDDGMDSSKLDSDINTLL